MFIELNSDELLKWNNMSEEEKKEALAYKRVAIAVDVYISKEKSGKVLEEHKYYQVYPRIDLIRGIELLDVDEMGATFLIKVYNDFDTTDKTKKIKIATNKEATVEVGSIVYGSTVRIKVTNFIYGKLMEL